MAGAKCTLASMVLLMDEEGIMGIFTFTTRLQLWDAK
jgi:hypothetical protein